jgi:hypothetical protein
MPNASKGRTETCQHRSTTSTIRSNNTQRICPSSSEACAIRCGQSSVKVDVTGLLKVKLNVTQCHREHGTRATRAEDVLKQQIKTADEPNIYTSKTPSRQKLEFVSSKPAQQTRTEVGETPPERVRVVSIPSLLRRGTRNAPRRKGSSMRLHVGNCRKGGEPL